MVKRILIDASHADETRVVVLSGNRLEEFDYESTARTQLKGNIYLAKVTRVEPSLQAAFVEYGGNRHGFLPFSEIHPDYYRIPIADREALIAEESASANGDDDVDTESDDNGEGNGTATAADSEDESGAGSSDEGENGGGKVQEIAVETKVDTVGGDDVEDAARKRAKLLRRYKIQEVIKRRQVILVQVAKEERGNKGAALTTYLSLAGRYCVLMPNTGRGGGISRKIGSAADRRRLKQVVSDLDIPDGMAVIVRTAGSERSKAEIRRDYEYLIRLWDQIREETLQSTAPALIHEEANLMKRAIRDLYDRDMEEILVQGEEGYKAAKNFMKNLMPSHARKVKLYKDGGVPLFLKHNVESQLDAMHSPSVQLKSGGYIVINPTEALVAIDVNSGKATRERHIEETARNTNIEAAEEVARQLRLRDLAGLIVIDFIDMEEHRHNRDVERRFKEAMRHDRARIQLGRISPFGLLEMSRQRLRPSLFDTSTQPCSRCHGTGRLRTDDSAGQQILRSLEEEALRRGGGELNVAMPPDVALHLLNERRHRLVEIEQEYGLQIRIESDEQLVPPEFKLERLTTTESPRLPAEELPEVAEEEDGQRRRRGRRRRRRKDDEAPAAASEESAAEEFETGADEDAEDGIEASDEEERRKPRRRRGKRGGRRRAKRRNGEDQESSAEAMPAEAGEEEAGQPVIAETAADELADTEAADTEAADAQAVDGETEETPPKSRRRSRPRRGAKADTKSAEGAQADGGAESPEDTPEPVVAGDAEAAQPEDRAPKRPRRRTRAKPPASAVEDEPSAAPAMGQEPDQPAVPLAAATPEVRPAEPALGEAEIPGAGPQPDTSLPPAEQPPAVSEPQDDEADRPKRKGWWQRWN